METVAVGWSLWTHSSCNYNPEYEGCLIIKYFRNYIVIGVTSFNIGCNSILYKDGKSLFVIRDFIRFQVDWLSAQYLYETLSCL